MSPPRRARSGGRAVWVVLAAAVLAAALLAVALAGGDGAGDGDAAAGSVTVAGEELPPFEGGSDPALGMPAPALRGPGLDGGTVAVEPGAGPLLLVFLAHWCPVCQEEVPVVRRWLDDGGKPAEVGMVAVATSTDPARDNYPPTAWLEREGWAVPTILDGEGSPAARAYGLPGFPYWVLLDADGTVALRYPGRLSPEALSEITAELARRADGQ